MASGCGSRRGKQKNTWEIFPKIPCLRALHSDVAPFFSSLRVSFDLKSVQTFGSLKKATSQFKPLWIDLAKYTSLKSLNVAWRDEEKDRSTRTADSYYNFLADELVQALYKATGGKLSELTWRPHNPYRVDSLFPESRQPLLGLEQLLIRSSDPYETVLKTTQIESLLGNIVFHNPGLRLVMLEVDSPFPLCTAEELFPTHHESLAFEKLKIVGTLPDLSPNAIRSHSVSLSSTPRRLSNMRNLQGLNIGFGEHRPQSSPNIDLLWQTLKDSGARLTWLLLSYGISETLVQYLASYEGLECGSFEFQVVPARLLPSSTSFVKDILPKHVSSLTELSITCVWNHYDPSRESMAFKPSIWPPPSSFTKLKILRILAPASWVLGNVFQFQQIIDYAMEIPTLWEITTTWKRMDQGIYMSTFGNHMHVMAEQLYVRKCALQNIKVIGEGCTSGHWFIEFRRIREESPNGNYKLSRFDFWCDNDGYDDDDDDDDFTEFSRATHMYLFLYINAILTVY
ncbi:hypothetical protein AX16_008998 [Volvariella volvacea WC 439]|nr:hypothetical protein AX16_008998 [Volvariella volvacea WC 439]